MNRKTTTLGCAALAAAVLLTVAVGYAEPLLDGDLFWHMAYAKQMLARGTLRLDHTAFSWTPTTNRMIYCAWASELLLHALWEHAGAWSLFALRYAVIVAAGLLLWDFARRLKLARWPVTYLVLLIAVLAESAGTIIKPELFSLLFMNLVVWAFFRGKEKARRGESPVRWFYAVPVLVALWVNFHGAFILVAPFLLATAAGEGVQFFAGRATALPARAYRHLLAAWALCAPATLLNPYGWRYPAQLFADYALARTPRPDVAWNAAHRSVFAASAEQSGLSLMHLMTLMLLLLAGALLRRALLAPRGARADCTALLANAAYLPLFMVYVRSTSFWIPVFGYSFLFVASGSATPERWRKWSRAGRAAAAVLVALFAGLAVDGARRQPSPRSWLGFGVSYWNPVPEAEFLSASRLEARLINLFDNGGYLLWRLEPRYLVMTDQRSFPYLSWFEEQYRFSNGEIFDEFLAAHPAETAVIDLAKEPVWRQFLSARDWRLAYYGPTAAVFVRQTVEPERLARDVAPERFRGLRNAGTAFRVFQFACAAGDFRTAWEMETQLATRLNFQASAAELRIARQYREAHRALRTGELPQAATLFRAALNGQPIGDRDRMILTFFAALEKLAPEARTEETATLQTALTKLAAPD